MIDWASEVWKNEIRVEMFDPKDDLSALHKSYNDFLNILLEIVTCIYVYTSR